MNRDGAIHWNVGQWATCPEKSSSPSPSAIRSEDLSASPLPLLKKIDRLDLTQVAAAAVSVQDNNHVLCRRQRFVELLGLFILSSVSSVILPEPLPGVERVVGWPCAVPFRAKALRAVCSQPFNQLWISSLTSVHYKKKFLWPRSGAEHIYEHKCKY